MRRTSCAVRQYGVAPTRRVIANRARGPPRIAPDPVSRTDVMHLPVLKSVLPYRPEWLRGDLIAGLTVWAVLVPEALAYASIAGVSPVVGLYAAPGALLLYA